MGLFLVSKTVQVVMVAGDVHPQWPSVLLLIVLALCCLALLAVSADPLPWPLTVAMAVVVPVLLYLVFTTTPSPTTAPQQTWPLGMVTAICIYLSIRGRTAAAWVLMIGCTAACAMWTVDTDRGIGAAVGLMSTTIAALVAATLFSLTIRPAVENIYELRNRSMQSIAAQVAALAVLQENREQMRYLDAEVRPTLNRIARPQPLTDAERDRCRRLEESLRDRLRAPIIAADPGTAGAAARARGRGIEVVLVDAHGLDDSAPRGARLGTRRGRRRARLHDDGVRGGACVATGPGTGGHRRHRPAGAGSEPVRLEFSADGERVDRPGDNLGNAETSDHKPCSLTTLAGMRGREECSGCGHPRHAHEHHRAGLDCAQCGCPNSRGHAGGSGGAASGPPPRRCRSSGAYHRPVYPSQQPPEPRRKSV